MQETGLILEGGGMRGIYTAGVLDFFLDDHIKLRRIYAVSAGACHACSYLSGQKDRARRTVMDYLKDPRYATFRSLRKTGDLFSREFVYDEIPNKLLPFDYDAFKESDFDFTVVVTNIRSGKAEYKKVHDLKSEIDIIRASSSLPYVSKKVEIDGEYYMDGGISDSIPYERSCEDGNCRNIVVLTRQLGYEKKPDSMVYLGRMLYRRYPELVESMKTRHQRYNDALLNILRGMKDGRVLIICPKSSVKVGRLEKDPERLYELYIQGYNDAKEKSAQLHKFLDAAQ